MFRFLVILLLLAVPVAAVQPAAAEPVTALILIDIQQFYFPGGAVPLSEPEAAGANAARILDRFRTTGDPVVHVLHEMADDMDAHPDVAPLEGETVIVKRQVNAFLDTPLLEVLQAQGVTRLVIVGMQTHMCVEAAVRAAVDLGFAVTVIDDACATRDLTHGGTTVAAADVHASTLATLRAYAEITATEAWLAR